MFSAHPGGFHQLKKLRQLETVIFFPPPCRSFSMRKTVKKHRQNQSVHVKQNEVVAAPPPRVAWRGANVGTCVVC